MEMGWILRPAYRKVVLSQKLLKNRKTLQNTIFNIVFNLLLFYLHLHNTKKLLLFYIGVEYTSSFFIALLLGSRVGGILYGGGREAVSGN